jgi:hypothetical protein
MRLFLNPERNAYLRELSDEFGASPSHIKDELEQLTSFDLLIRKKNGRQISFSANKRHPIFDELHSMVIKAFGMDQVLDSIIKRLGKLQKAFLIDDYAEGKDSGIIDLVLVGDIDKENLLDLTNKTEKYINRKIRSLIVTGDEFCTLAPTLDQRPQFVLWEKEAEQDKSL